MLLFVLGGFLPIGVVLGISAAPARQQTAPPTVTPTQSRTPGPPRTVFPGRLSSPRAAYIYAYPEPKPQRNPGAQPDPDADT